MKANRAAKSVAYPQIRILFEANNIVAGYISVMVTSRQCRIKTRKPEN